MSKSDSIFRDDFQSLLGGPRERRRILREIKQLEAEEMRRMHAGAAAESEALPEQLDGTYLTQPAPLHSLHNNNDRSGSQSKTELLYGRPASSYARGPTAPHNLLSAMEAELDPATQQERLEAQRIHAASLSVPRVTPSRVFTDYIKAPSAMRKRGLRSSDVLFEPGPDDNGVFWLYDKHRVSQSTLGSAAGSMTYASVKGGEQQGMDEAAFKRLPVWANIKRKLSNMIAQGAQQERFGIVFDIVSTGKILAKGIPHMAGKLIYEFVEDCRHEAGVNKLKFVFVGITDNINCCTARDVFCLDDRIGGVYVGGFKRPFTALDNVHMFAVLPPTGSKFYDSMLHSREPGYHLTHADATVSQGVNAINTNKRSQTPAGNHSTNAKRGLPPLPRSETPTGNPRR